MANNENPPLAEMTDVTAILKLWDDTHSAATFDPVPFLERLAELVEIETENYLKMDPDPFDDRNPSRNPNCNFGVMLKIIFKKESFMSKLVGDYLRDTYWTRLGISNRDSRELNTAAARLVLDLMPGLETSVVFQDTEGLILRLFGWAEKALEPLQSYATGLLASAMELQDVAANFREQNAVMVPLMLRRLKELQVQMLEERRQEKASLRPLARLLREQQEEAARVKSESVAVAPEEPFNPKIEESDEAQMDAGTSSANEQAETAFDSSWVDESGPSAPATVEKTRSRRKRTGVTTRNKTVRKKLDTKSPVRNGIQFSENSNSSWAEMESNVIGTYQMHPLTQATKQILILRYLTPMGEYQELLSHVFEQNAMKLIFNYINIKEMKDTRLAFEALKYLAALLCHKKFAIEFINMQGLQRLLEVPRPSVAATGVSMCLYYLAYCEDAMERVCVLPQHILQELVKYALWLLECSHESGRCHATMFFGSSFQFRVILELFDSQDGLRRLYNMISTLSILSADRDDLMSDDEEFAARQTVRHVCAALKRYFECHLAVKAEQVQRTHARDVGGTPPPSIPPFKAMKLSIEGVQEHLNTLQELVPLRANWAPVSEFMRLGGITLLLQAIALAYDWLYTGRAETVRSALDVLAVCAVLPRVQLAFCEPVEIPDTPPTVGMNILLGAAEGEIVADADVQRSALNAIINCVCTPIVRLGDQVGGNLSRFAANNNSSTSNSARKRMFRTNEDILNRVWECVRANNGIMVLMELMMVKTPITDADSIRALACCALVGLARSETVRQIMGKLPLFTGGSLQVLMREPILQDKRQEHVKFQRYALELLEKVSGKIKPSVNEFEISLAKIHRADVVAQTRIQFNEKQLLQLIQQHLASKGLIETAAVLQKEAGLPGLPLKVGSGSNFPPYRPVTASPSTPARSIRTPLAVNASTAIPSTSLIRLPSTSQTPGLPSTPVSSAGASLGGLPLRVSVTHRRPDRPKIATPSSARSLEKQTSVNSLAPPPVDRPGDVSSFSLDTIVTQYLMNQHALCKNPMVTVPQFDLFLPHKCPDPESRNSAPINFTMRYYKRALFPPWGGPNGAKFDRRLVYSRFRPVRTYRQSENDTFFTCSAFSSCEQFLMVGTFTGELKLFNLHTGSVYQKVLVVRVLRDGIYQDLLNALALNMLLIVVEEATYQCHDATLVSVEPNWEGNLLLTSASWRRPLSALWSVGDFFDMKFAFDDEEFVEFSKTVQDKIVGTKGAIASIYDVNTGRKLVTLEPRTSNMYTKNRATFHPTDELILSDGVLWDATSRTQIHKFDKLNQTLSGVFHPNGLEIISSSQVWDLRTFHLLRTVPTLDQCKVVFSASGDIIYAVSLDQETEEDQSYAYESSFKTLDARDYSSIATFDVKKNVFGLCVNKYDTQIAVVENTGDSSYEGITESIVRLYDVGRLRDDEEQAAEAEEEEEEEGMDNSDDASDNSDTEGAFSFLDSMESGTGSDDDFDDAEDDNDDDDNDSMGSTSSVTTFSDNSHASSVSEDDDGLFALND